MAYYVYESKYFSKLSIAGCDMQSEDIVAQILF